VSLVNHPLSTLTWCVLGVFCLASCGALWADSIQLSRGVNLVAVPGAPASCSARSLAQVLGASLVARSVSEAGQAARLEAFMPDLSSGDGFPVTSHAGYVVILPQPVLFDPVALTVTSGVDGFKLAGSWEAFDAGSVGTGSTFPSKGYYGAVSDGRYIYYTPCRALNPGVFHGHTLRYDLLGSFTSAASWQAYDASSTNGLNTRGYAGNVFDGRYVYYVPYANNSAGDILRHARVLRYDTQGAYTAGTSWDAYNAGATSPIPANSISLGYDGAVWDGSRYVYFVPYGDQSGTNPWALRYDTQNDASFQTAGNWAVYNVMYTSGLTRKGYYGGAFDGRYVYYAPFASGSDTAFHGQVLRYDTTQTYSQAASWTVHDAGATGGMATVGYKGAVFDGRYVYFVPFRDTASTQHTRVLRYDTQGSFTAPASWSAYDAGGTDGLNTVGYVGAVFDGRFLYFIPYQQGTSYHANVLRYDTRAGLTTAASWSAFNAGAVGGMNTKGYKYATYSDPYVYFVPYNNFTGTGSMESFYHAIALRYRVR
jgi:hypothetical protein